MLYNTIREITCCNMVHTSARDQLFYNFKLGGRGSIRKPPNLIDWTLSLRQLAARAGTQGVLCACGTPNVLSRSRSWAARRQP